MCVCVCGGCGGVCVWVVGVCGIMGWCVCVSAVGLCCTDTGKWDCEGTQEIKGPYK